MISPKVFLRLLIQSLIGWNQSNALRHAAALAFYTIFSLAPLVTLAVAIVSIVFRQATIEAQIVGLVEQYLGRQAADVVVMIMGSTGVRTSQGLPALISLGMTIFGASLVFRELQSSLNTMWSLASEPISPEVKNLWRSLFTLAKTYLVSTGAALALGFLLLILLLLSAFGTTLMHHSLPGSLPDPLTSLVVQLLSFVAAPLLFMLIFAALFKFLPLASIRWREVWPGAALTAILVWLGGYGVGLYLLFSPISSAYGAASTMTVFLLWVFISTSIVLYGAKFTQLYAGQRGEPIQPKEGVILTPAPPEPKWLALLK